MPMPPYIAVPSASPSLADSPRPFDPRDAELVIDPDTAPIAEVEAELCRWAGRISAATCHWLRLVAAFDRRKAWFGIGIKTCAHWLSLRCGLGLRTAQEHLRTAHALERLPEIHRAFAAGQLSYSKVRAVARVATPETDDLWLRRARACTGSELERLTAAYRQHSADPAPRGEGRRLTVRTDDDGMTHITVVLPAEDAAVVLTALDTTRTHLDSSARGTGDQAAETDRGPKPTVDDVSRDDVSRDDVHRAGGTIAVPRHRERDADALVALAEAALHHDPPRLLNPAHTITVHVRPSATIPITMSSPLGAGVGLPPAVLERLACDGHLRALHTDDHGDPLHLGRRRRFPTQHLRAAVHLRDDGRCQFPGCTHSRWLHIHHCRPWREGGATDIEALTLLCGRHHRAVHDHAITVHRGRDGTLRLDLPDGRTLTGAQSTHPGADPLPALAHTTRHVTDRSVLPTDTGPLSLDDSLYVLLNTPPRQAPATAGAGAAGW